jgi:hypothetical protein
MVVFMEKNKKMLYMEFWAVSLKDLEKIRNSLYWYRKMINSLIAAVNNLIDNWDIATENDVEKFLWDVCEFFNDCTVCPLTNICRLFLEECTEPYLCAYCPRVKYCLEIQFKKEIGESDEV